MFRRIQHADQLAEVSARQGDANLVAHIQRGAVRTEAHVPIDLKGANPLLARQDKVHDAEPLSQRFVGVFKDRADRNREAIPNAIGRAFVALPVPLFRAMFGNVVIAAARAGNAIGPAMVSKVRLAIILVPKLSFKLTNVHLVNVQRARGFWHGVSPLSWSITPCYSCSVK